MNISGSWRRHLIRHSVRVALAIAALAFAGGAAAEPAPRPNILFVLTEDQGAHMGCLGTAGVETPHMDALAASATLFRTAWVGYPVCSASKACLLTGLDSTVNGLLNNMPNYFKPAARLTPAELADPRYHATRIRSPAPTLVEHLVAAGYHAGITGKLHVAPNERFPYHEFLRPDGGRQLANFAARAREAGRPWFLFHNSITHSHRPFANGDSEPLGVDPAAVRLPAFLPDTPVARQDWAEYLDGVERNDAALGKLLTQLQATGEADHTVVVFMGDHGHDYLFATVSGRQFGAKQGMEERTVRDDRYHLIARSHLDEPRFLNDDSIRWKTWRCRIHDEIVRHADAHPEPFRILAEHLPATLGGEPPALECYDLEADPDEMHDLLRSPQPPEVAARIAGLHAALVAWAEANGDERFACPPLPRGSAKGP